MIVCTLPDYSTTVRAADKTRPAKTSRVENSLPEFDSDRAFGYLTKICDIGPRISGSQGMEQQQQLIAGHFAKLKAQVKFQSFDAPHPLNGKPVRMNNIIVTWDPQATERVLLACHYDTRPHADRDPNPRLASEGTFLGANDGASGVALLMELGNQIRAIKPTYGVDFVFFDGEELVYGERDPYFLGAEYFSKQYRDKPPDHKYVCGVLVDMIGGKKLQLYQEINSLNYAAEVTQSVWKTARRLGVKEFVARPKHDVRDDHLALNEIAGIPSCDIIDFGYEHWHTTKDVPAACSGESLAKVGRVLLAWLEEVPAPTKKPEKKRRGRSQ
jgi:glutaminyl-peptide cyclotransferase